jgi:hypothetical protein
MQFSETFSQDRLLYLGVVPVAMDGMNTVTLRAAGGMKLYRLRKPFINE